MTQLQAADAPPVAAIDPARLTADRPMTDAERAAYIAHHRARNAANDARSRRLRVGTHPSPAASADVEWFRSSSKASIHGFVRWAARRLASSLPRRPVTILDIGAGFVPYATHLANAGIRGTYITADIQERPAPGIDAFNFTRIVGDAHDLTRAELPTIDLLMSCVALEHIDNELELLRTIDDRLRPIAHLHCVPATASMNIYGPHGYRYYSAACAAELVPGANIYRLGGLLSNAVQNAFCDHPSKSRPSRSGPLLRRAYPPLRDLALTLDRWTGNRSPSAYGVLRIEPDRPARRPADVAPARASADAA